MKTNLKTALMVLATTTLMASSFSAIAAAKKGGDSGGGGGAYIAPSGKLLTLPEAGILISDAKENGKRFEKYYFKNQESYEEAQKEVALLVEKMKKVIPELSLEAKYVMESRSTYLEKEVDVGQYQKIKSEYKAVFKQYNYKLDDERFVLPAYSVVTHLKDGEELRYDSYGAPITERKTYILPDFKKLNPEQQARIFIHEYLMRDKGRLLRELSREQKLKTILATDTIVDSMLNGENVLQKNLKNVIKNFSEVGLLYADDAKKISFKTMLEEMNSSVLVKDIVLDVDKFTFYEKAKIDPSLIQEIQDNLGLKQNYAELLEGALAGIDMNFLTRMIKDEELAQYKILANKLVIVCKNNNIPTSTYALSVVGDDILVFTCGKNDSLPGVAGRVRFSNY